MAKTYILALSLRCCSVRRLRWPESTRTSMHIDLLQARDQNSQHVRTGLPWEAERSLSTHHQTFP